VIKNIYYSKWFPRLFYTKMDGGNDSGVTGYFLIEWKLLFSIGFLHFKRGSREAFHSHAFNAVTFWLKGSVTEIKHPTGIEKDFSASFRPKYTPKSNFHKIYAHTDSFALTFRGPWLDYWYEFKNKKYRTLTHGRKEIV
jgi:hypothetical protein